MRLIAKNTKVKMQFYKGITFIDIIIGFIILLIVALVLSSNLPYKFVVSVAVIGISVPAFLSIGEEKIYMSGFYIVKHLFSKNKYSAAETICIIPYEKIESNYIKNKDGTLFGVIEIKPIEFRLLSGSKQDYIIDGVMTTVLENICNGREACIVKLDKPFKLDNHINKELERLNAIIQNKGNKVLSDTEYEARVDIIQDRMTLLDNLNSESQVSYSAYYLVLLDKDESGLISSLYYAKQLLNSAGIEANLLENDELTEFIKLSIDGTPFETEQQKTLEEVKPKQIEFKALNTRQDNKVLSHFIVCDYPLQVGNAWGEEFFDIPDTKVVMKLKAVEKSKAIKRIDNAIMELSTQVKGKASKIIDKTTHIETLLNLLTRLQNDNETMFDVTLIITAIDDYGSNIVKKSVKRKLKESGLTFNEMFGRQQDAYLTNMLAETDKVKISRGIPSTTVAACFPFVSNAIVDDNGIILGENKLPVLIDFFKRDNDHVNSNMIIIGKPGSGKSYATKTLLSHLSSLDTKVFCIDPENEYTKLTESLGGKVLDVSSAKFGKINPFQIIATLDDENDDGSNNNFYAHLQFLEQFFKLIFEGLNSDCFELLNKAVVEIYGLSGIDSNSKLSELIPADYPTFEELALLIDNKIKTEQDSYTLTSLKILANYLSKFRTGGRNSALWNGSSSFNATENFVCFNFQKLLANKNNSVANAQMLLTLKWIENEVIKNREYNLKYGTNRKIIIIIDEAHIFIDEKFPVALDFMYQLGKRIRKYDGMQIVITQNIKDFVGNAETSKKSMAIINVSQYSLIFSLSPNDMTDLCKLYEKAGQINEAESDNIIYNPRGCAFLISSPSSRTNVKIVATPFIENSF